ncbi:hypothetical protein HH310_25175 [Actinoplanes sp. TBRC 11911]|uniref:hypothetical protein n=1 Tax=Actinoplanes sp. TBRC 11911 TaxID=2729386 RepID=UPI00145F1505|nr:hypothetical protein [Actinoplanes sp. TBRC 11911]NMO54464.1 hypothetical protein [Actinoplanes sp. TBRC 11911]
MASPQQQPIDITGPEEVVEFGPAPPSRARWNSTTLRSLAADRRAVPLTAVLAAAAFFAAIISEWQITTVDQQFSLSGVGRVALPTGVADLGALGTGFMIGVFLLAVTIVLTMFGPPAGRHYARLMGLSAGGTLLGLLFAITFVLGSDSRTVPRTFIEVDRNDVQIAYGRGVWCAVAGAILALIALYLAGRHVSPAAGETGAAGDTVEHVDEPAAVWSWRRPPAPNGDQRPDEPLGLTVMPAQPFTPAPGDRDHPNGSHGISG